MASVATLGFSIISRYSGRGMAEARRDIASTRAFLSLLNEDIRNHTRLLNNVPTRWKAIGVAVGGLAPALVPLTAQLLSTAAALTTMGTAAGGAAGVWGLALKGALGRINETATGVMALGKNLAKQKAILDNMTPGTAHYEKQLKAVAKAQDQYNHALADADPSQKAFLGSMLKMNTAWEKFITATQGQTLGVAGKVVEGIAVAIGKLEPVVRAVTPLANNIAESFQRWVNIRMDGWMKFLIDVGVPALTNMVTIGKNLMSVFGTMLKDFSGEAIELSNALARGSANLKAWADGGGFKRFIDYVNANSPKVQAFWRAFMDALGGVLRILKEFSNGSLNVLTDALRAIAGIDPGAVMAFANSLILLKSPMLWLVLNCPPLRDMIVAILGALNAETIYAIAAAFMVWRAAILAVNLGLIGTPVGWIITGIAALGAAIVFIATKTTWFQTAWTYTWNFIKTVASAVWNWIQTTWDTIIGGLYTAWITVSGAIVTAWNTVWNALKTAATTVWSALTTAWNAVAGFFTTIWNTVSAALTAAWNTVWNGIKTAAKAVWDFLQPAWNAFVTALQTIWAAISGPLQAAWSVFWTVIRTTAEAVWAVIKAAWQLLVNTFQTVWQAVSAVLSAAWNVFWTGIKAAAELVWNALKVAWQALWTALTTAWNTFKALIQAAWTVFWTALKTAADLVWNALKTAWQALWTALTTAWNAFKALLQGAWNVFWEGLKAAANLVWEAIKGLWNTFWENIKTIWNGFKEFFTGGWQDFWDGVKNVASKVWDGIVGVIEKGVNLAIDIVNGIIGAWNTVTSAIGLDSLNIDKVGHVSFAVGGVVGDVPHFAAGGTVNFTNGGTLSGYAPGRDTVPAVLSRGEGVLTPEAVRGLGGAGFVHSANRAFAGHRGAGRGAAPLSAFGFAQGGTVNSPMGSTRAWHREGRDVGWSFAVGGLLPTEVPIPDPDGPKGPSTGGGTMGQKPEQAKETKGIMEASGLSTVTDAFGNAMDFGTMVLGFIGEAAIRAAFNAVTGMIDGFGGFGPFGEILKGMLNKLKESLIDNLIKRDSEAKKEYESMAVAGPMAVGKWAGLAAKALQMAGLNPNQLGAFLALMQAESGGNPNAMNGWDINAKNGVPSQGLMQVIPPTFSAYHVAGTSNNILDPLANMAASANYIKHRYGGNVPGSPYALGTPGATRGTHLVGEQGPELVNFAGGESVTPAKETSSILSGGMAAGGGMAGGITGMLQGIMASGGTPEEMLAQFEQIIAAAQAMATQVKTSWGMVTTSATTSQAGLAPVVSDIVAKHQTEIPTAMNAMVTANTTAWTGMTTGTTTQWTALRDGTYTEAGDYMGTKMPTWGTEMDAGVTAAWTDMSAATAAQWGAMKEGTSEPVNWIIENPYNNGIASMWNAVAGVIWEGGGRELPTISGFASGGKVSGPGTGTSDSVPAMLSRGEHVLTAREVQAAGGHQAIYRMRDGLLRKDGWAGFAAGGAVDGELKRGNLWAPIEGTMRAAVSDTQARLTDLFGRTSGSADIVSPADWIEQYVKKDDELNKFVGGPPWIPGVSDAITSWGGVTVNQRTADMLNAAMALGFSGSASQGSFSTGVAASAGTHDGGGVVDLTPATAGNIGALRAVGFAAWGRGPEWGSPSFASHIHAVALGDPTVSPGAAAQQASFLAGGNGLADGGPDNFSGGIPAIAYKDVDPADIKQNVVSYDQGGYLQPGLTVAYNGTGKPEPVGHDLVPRGSGGVTVNMPLTINGNANAQEIVDAINSQALPQLRQMLVKGTGSNG